MGTCNKTGGHPLLAGTSNRSHSGLKLHISRGFCGARVVCFVIFQLYIYDYWMMYSETSLKTTWEIGTAWLLRTATSVHNPIYYVEMDLTNIRPPQNSGQFFTVPWVSYCQGSLYLHVLYTYVVIHSILNLCICCIDAQVCQPPVYVLLYSSATERSCHPEISSCLH